MTKENGSVEHRLAFLEKAYLEDRRRWDRNEGIMRGMLQVLKRQGDQIDKHAVQLEKLWEQVAKQGERLDLWIRMYRHKSEQ